MRSMGRNPGGKAIERAMSDYKDWKIILTFHVPAADVEGVFTEAYFDAALEVAPSEAAGLVASANTDEGRVRIVFTLVESSREMADSVARDMPARVQDAVRERM